MRSSPGGGADFDFFFTFFVFLQKDKTGFGVTEEVR